MSREFGFIRISCAVPAVSVANVQANTAATLDMLRGLPDSDIVLFPELGISGYSCGRLFHQDALLDATEAQLLRLAAEMPHTGQLVLVGAPLRIGTALYNCAVAINDGRIVGIVPKQYLPNYNEFYEARWFASAQDLDTHLTLGRFTVPVSTQLLFAHGSGAREALIHVEICEDMWMPVPPSSLAALSGATILCNLSASPETIGKAPFRRMLAQAQSGRCLAAYAYASCGPTESTADLVYGGHALIADNGRLVAESPHVGHADFDRRGNYSITADIDIERLKTERRTTTTFAQSSEQPEPGAWQHVRLRLQEAPRDDLLADIPAHPFVPADPETLAQRCSEIFGIQTAALAKRLDMLGDNPSLVIGVSGGLDSTLALLVATRTCDMLDLPRARIRGVTMPGFGTTDHTYGNAQDLMRQLGITASEIDIRQACLDEYIELARVSDYRPFGRITLTPDTSLSTFQAALDQLDAADKHDLVFENVQARRRTQYLMNLGFVLGTGDMSELWLGWCTYNADHQSMYNVNCSVPKTLVRFLVEYAAEHEFDGETRATLSAIAATEISPELLPVSADGSDMQSTEASVGPYELHDFFMFNMARYGFSPRKILYLAQHARGFSGQYSDADVRHWLRENIRRAFSQQYKRDDVPNGPKVGTLSLSPRGDWRMPSDASAASWLAELDID